VANEHRLGLTRQLDENIETHSQAWRLKHVSYMELYIDYSSERWEVDGA